MPFQLDGVVPWGRSMAEYRLMFQLSDDDMTKNIAGFGDGPASFNCEATRLGCSVTSFDPIYQFSEADLRRRIDRVRAVVMEQMRENRDNYVWTHIPSLDALEAVRMSSMELFLADYETGKAENRYLCHELPENLPCGDNTYDIGLSSHFLLMYTTLGYAFHIQAIAEMLRVCREIRIFPIADLDANKTDLISDVIHHFECQCQVEIIETEYEFQKGANKLLTIRKGW